MSNLQKSVDSIKEKGESPKDDSRSPGEKEEDERQLKRD